MSKSEVDESSGMMNTSLSLNQDLVRQLNALSSENHTASDCWSPAKPMVVEAAFWVAAAAVLWIVTLSLAS
ncbi:hypothetical protein D3C76_1651640 [compost metagenome]|uniref:hypothetical protein n=1 Tax=Pseudomonas sp. JM0905a TaxID=2772484 RepID=UPI000FBB4C24|nr:hypothetical protein [Pseudomonas sp. JM0905a]MBD2835572.1 hypothetical protein [Pseudomonas sp. JM0905a]